MNLMSRNNVLGIVCLVLAIPTALQLYADAYTFVVLDNEAGMEHLSRRTTNQIDLLAIITEPTRLADLVCRLLLEKKKKNKHTA